MYRNLPLNIILTIVTCGLYGLYWFVVLTDDVNELSGRKDDTSGLMSLALTIITCGIYGIYWAYRMGEKVQFIKQMYYGKDSSESILYMIITIVGYLFGGALFLVIYALIQFEINNIIEGKQGQYQNNMAGYNNYNGYNGCNSSGADDYNAGGYGGNQYGSAENNDNNFGYNNQNFNGQENTGCESSDGNSGYSEADRKPADEKVKDSSYDYDDQEVEDYGDD